MSGQNTKFLVFFGIFWSAMTLLFDGLLIVPAVRQVAAQRFSTTEGTMLSSEVTHNSDGDGTTHGVAVSYTYTVAGKEYEGNRYRYDTSTSSDSKWAYRAVAEHPPGAKVRVYYNPSNPVEALLVPGILGSDLFMMTFLTPFNGAMLAFWWAGWIKLRRKWFKPVAGGVKIKTELRRTRARLTEFSPLGAGLGMVVVLAFISIFPIAFLGGGFHPSVRTMQLTWMAIMAGSGMAAVWHAYKIISGKYDLIIDDQASALELPLTCGRKTRRRVMFAQIQGVRVEEIQKKSSSEDGQTTAYYYAPVLDLSGAEGAKERLAEWTTSTRAEDFVEWLRAQLPPPKKIQRPLAGRFESSTST